MGETVPLASAGYSTCRITVIERAVGAIISFLINHAGLRDEPPPPRHVAARQKVRNLPSDAKLKIGASRKALSLQRLA